MHHTPASTVCSECGAQNAADAEHCWLCHGATTSMPEATSPFAVNVPPRVATPLGVASHQFALSELFVWMTFLAVTFGAFAQFPPLGVFMAITGVVTLVRTRSALGVARAQGTPLSGGDTALAYLKSLGLSVVAAILAILVFYVAVVLALAIVCSPLGNSLGNLGPPVLIALMVFVVVAPIVCAVWLLRKTWPKHRLPK